MSHTRYTTYRATGLEWLETIPSHWEVKRLKQFCSVFPSNVDKKSVEGETPVKLCNYTDVYYNDFIAEGLDFMEATATEDQIKKFTLKEGDTVITKDSEAADDIAIAACVTKDLPGVICGYHLSVVRPKEVAYGAFVKRLFDSIYAKSLFAVRANGLTRVSLSQYAIDNVELPLPPINEQKAIATFLDCETAKIDALIAEQQRLIELLQEKRQAVISHAVAKGLNPDAPMKDSGVEWLGEVPEHWEVMGLTKAIGPVVDYRGRTPTKCDSGTLLVTAKNIRNGEIDYALSEEYVDPVEAEELLQRGRPEIGDVLFTMEAPLGQVALVDREDIALAQRVVKFRGIKDRMTNSFLMWWLIGSHCQYQLNSLSTGSTALGVKASKLSAVICVVPPVSEQQAIDAHIRDFTTQFSSVHAAALDQIELLQERRSALISAAVTGQIDVRGLVPEASAA